MRYALEYEDGLDGLVWFVVDMQKGLVVSLPYMNKYMAQTEVDRLNERERKFLECYNWRNR